MGAARVRSGECSWNHFCALCSRTEPAGVNVGLKTLDGLTAADFAMLNSRPDLQAMLDTYAMQARSWDGLRLTWLRLLASPVGIMLPCSL
jgi:hypothetical protein